MATLDVMVLESERGAADSAIRDLTDAGHRVLRCHDPAAPVFPCRGLIDESSCPLRAHSVDVALTVRRDVSMHPAESEDGARCALMNNVPLVVAGPSVFDPYADLEARLIEPDGDVVSACEAAAADVLAGYARRAEAVIASTITTAGSVPTVTVIRRDHELSVRIAGLDGCTREEHRAAVVRVLGALRGIDPSVHTTDVSLVMTQPGHQLR